MKDWLMQRSKAFSAAFAPIVFAALMTALEQTLGITFGDETKLALSSVVFGLVVHEVPNKK